MDEYSSASRVTSVGDSDNASLRGIIFIDCHTHY